MEVSVSGFKCVGTWDEVVKHGDKITAAIEEADEHETEQEAFEQWNEWRPAADDTLSDEITERTAEQASVDEGAGEEEGTPATKDAKEVGKKIAKSPRKAVKESPQSAGQELKEGAKHAARAVDSASRKTLRQFEETVYEHVMTKMSPYYFDNELISANIRRKTGLNPVGGGDDSDDIFIFEVNVNDDELKSTLKEALSEEIEESVTHG